MEHHDPARRQYVPQNYSSQQAQPTSAPTSGQYVGAQSDRYRQSAYLQESPISPAATGRGGGDAQQMYGFTPATPYGAGSTMAASGLPYGPDLQTPESQRQQAQTYQPYGSHVLYSMSQPQPGSSPYDQASHYRSRQNTTSETLGAPFGVPQNTQYYLAGAGGQPSATAAEMTAAGLPSQYPQPDPYPQAGPPSAQPYPGGMMDPSQTAQYGTYVQQQPQPQYTAPPTQPAIDQSFERYENQIRTIFTLAREGSLRDIGSHLLDVSTYLLRGAESLGLTRDEDGLHDNRLRLWEEFNRAWLVTLQRQYDMTEEMMRTGRPPREPQSWMSAQTLEQLGQELVGLCDVVEKHGLVDYQMGVAEEEIMDLLTRCTAVLEPPEEQFSEGATQAQASSSGALRER